MSRALLLAITLTDGLALVSPMDADSALEEKLFSARYSCPYCDYSLQELEPRMFSFNNPNGACPECDGLGVSQFFDPERVVSSTHVSLAGGAVRGWDRRNAYYFQIIRSLARHYDFDVDTPFTPDDLDALSTRMRKIIKEGQRFSRRVVADSDARDELADEPYKLELIGLKAWGDDPYDGFSSEVVLIEAALDHEPLNALVGLVGGVLLTAYPYYYLASTGIDMTEIYASGEQSAATQGASVTKTMLEESTT